MNFKALTIAILCAAALAVGCKDNIAEQPNGLVQDKTPYTLQYGQFPTPQIAADNPLTVEGVKLGRMLFYDKKLSGDETQACASCHLQAYAFSDPAQFSVGIRGQKGKRHAMSVFNMAWNENGFFWDGKSILLRHQSLLPILDELEMDETLENVVAKLTELESYKNQFIRAFGSEEITPEKMGLALEQFMNSITSTNARYDDFLQDSTVFNASEKRGLKLFNTEYNPFFPELSGADCQHCHSGFNFENDRYMNNGLDEAFDDFGRGAVTGKEADNGKFKVTSLRNIALTAPYMHDGRFSTLEEVIDHYNSGLKYSTTLDLALEQTRETGLMLTAQNKKDLIAFLKTLTDKDLTTNPNYSNPF